MKSWKSKRTICRKTQSGRFAKKAKCGAYQRQRIRLLHTLFHL